MVNNAALDHYNYVMDPRTQGPAPEQLVLYTHVEGLGDLEVIMPSKVVTCSVCEGKGTHVNPSIDAGGLTHEDFYQDEDFLDDYKSGVYDVQCYSCGGKGTALVVDEEACTPELLKKWEWQREQDYYSEMESRAERAMGA